MSRTSDDSKAGRRRAKRQGLAYQGAFEAVVAILIAAGIGIWIDGRYDTSPYGLLGGLAVGFSSFVLRLVRMGARLQALDDEGGDADRMDEKSP